MKLAGGCRCGHVRYTLEVDRLPAAYACHCLDCQTWSGSAFSEQMLVAEAAITVDGPVVTFELTGPSGRVSRQRVCSTCHTRIFNTNSALPGIAALRAGTLDASDQLDIVAHIWTRRKQPWIILPPDIPAWPESAPPDDFFAALRRA